MISAKIAPYLADNFITFLPGNDAAIIFQCQIVRLSDCQIVRLSDCQRVYKFFFTIFSYRQQTQLSFQDYW